MTKEVRMCKCCGKHIPKPMILLDLFYWDLILDTDLEEGPSITLCPTTFANVEHLWSIYKEFKARPPWHVLQNYSQFVQEIVEHCRELERRGKPVASRLDADKLGATTSLGRNIVSEAIRPDVAASEATRISMVD